MNLAGTGEKRSILSKRKPVLFCTGFFRVTQTGFFRVTQSLFSDVVSLIGRLCSGRVWGRSVTKCDVWSLRVVKKMRPHRDAFVRACNRPRRWLELACRVIRFMNSLFLSCASSSLVFDLLGGAVSTRHCTLLAISLGMKASFLLQKQRGKHKVKTGGYSRGEHSRALRAVLSARDAEKARGDAFG